MDPNASSRSPSYLAIIRNPNVHAEIERAWRSSRPDAPDVPPNPAPSPKREHGGWVVYNHVAATFRLIHVPPGTRDTLPIGLRLQVRWPEQVVALFHTHPNTRAEKYDHRPSAGGRAIIAPLGIIGIVRSHHGYHEVLPL